MKNEIIEIVEDEPVIEIITQKEQKAEKVNDDFYKSVHKNWISNYAQGALKK